MRKFILIIFFATPLLLSSGLKDIPHCKFKFESFSSLNKILEPTDIVYDKDSKHLFIVSGHGILFECDLTGKVIRKASEEGMDFEGVEVTDSFVYVSDEKPRQVYKYRKSDLSFVRAYNVTWGGASNKAFESITYNATKKCFILVSQYPVFIIEYNDDFKEIDRHHFHGPRDISGARWHNGYIYLLSNLDETIFKCDPTTYDIKEYYKIDVLNPEGMTFDGQENISITSDALQRIYFFKQLPTIKQ